MRNYFLAAAAAALLLTTVPANAQNLRLLVGTNTENTASEGVYLYSYEPQTAATEYLGAAFSGNPTFVISSPDGAYAYAVNEFNDGRQAVSSYRLKDGSIELLDSCQLPSGTENPCNILFTGSAVVTANYFGGTVTSIAISQPGIFAGLRQQTGNYEGESSHMHCSVLSPDGRYIFVTDLERDCIYRFEREAGGAPLGERTTAWKEETDVHYGPRHLIFSADGRFAYLLCELSDNLVVFSHKDGVLTPIQDLKAYKGKGHGSADLHLSPDGRFLYTSHRLKKDGLSIFSVDSKTGKVTEKGYVKTGIHPRNFAISPDGRYILCACRDSNRIEIYERNQQTGALRNTGKSIEVPEPMCVQFL